MRIEIAGSAAKAKMICSRFPPSWIIWDGHPRPGCPLQEYLASVPDALWPKVIPTSVDSAALDAAKAKGALEAVSKQTDCLHTWSDRLAEALQKRVPPQEEIALARGGLGPLQAVQRVGVVGIQAQGGFKSACRLPRSAGLQKGHAEIVSGSLRSRGRCAPLPGTGRCRRGDSRTA